MIDFFRCPTSHEADLIEYYVIYRNVKNIEIMNRGNFYKIVDSISCHLSWNFVFDPKITLFIQANLESKLNANFMKKKYLHTSCLIPQSMYPINQWIIIIIIIEILNNFNGNEIHLTIKNKRKCLQFGQTCIYIIVFIDQVLHYVPWYTVYVWRQFWQCVVFIFPFFLLMRIFGWFCVFGFSIFTHQIN